MQKLRFSIDINSTPERVWNTLWKDETYRKWTSAFIEGSYALSDWEEGDKILFLSPGGEGIYSRIEKKIPNALMSFKHLGMIKGGKEQPNDDETRKWSGALETYNLNYKGSVTMLTVDIDIAEGHKKYFEETFPKALEMVKVLSEGKLS